jgi:hypothetical protein
MASEYKIIGGKLDGKTKKYSGYIAIDDWSYGFIFYYCNYPVIKQEYKIDKENKTITFVRDIPIV